MGGNVKAHDTIAEIYDNNHTYVGLVALPKWSSPDLDTTQYITYKKYDILNSKRSFCLWRILLNTIGEPCNFFQMLFEMVLKNLYVLYGMVSTNMMYVFWSSYLYISEGKTFQQCYVIARTNMCKNILKGHDHLLLIKINIILYIKKWKVPIWSNFWTIIIFSITFISSL